MISFDEIQKSYPAELNQSRFHHAMLKEFFQYKMLEIIFNSQWGGSLVLLGGTNLRIFHGVNRFSEDLDFDITGKYTGEAHEALCHTICKELAKEGYVLETDEDRTKRNPKRTAFTRFINFPGLLKKMGLHDDPNKKFLVKIDAEAHSYGEFSYEPEQRLINKFDVYTSVSSTPADVILSTKLCSILERSKGRDFFDIVTLSEKFKANEGYLSGRFEFGQLREKYFGPVHLQESILAVTQKVNWKDKLKDAERFLFNEKEANKILRFRNWVEDTLFFRTFGLARENGVITDPRPGLGKEDIKRLGLHPQNPGMDTIRFRLNPRNPRYEMSIRVNETNRILIEGNRNFPDVRAGFKSTTGIEELFALPDSTDHQIDYQDRTKSIFYLELNRDSTKPVNLEVRFS
jgi:predicted nucleotidyltransferase component of viral defense system